MGVYLGPFRISKRGVRVRVGPRIMRVHLGTGRPGISTGAGPFTIYQPLGRKRRKSASRYWSGFNSDGSKCPHLHRTEQAAQECTRRLQRQAGLPHAAAPAPDPQPVRPAAADWPLAAGQPRRPIGWPGWTIAGAVAGLAVTFVLAGIGGSNSGDAASLAAGGVGAFALIALCVAVPAALYRTHRARRPTGRPGVPAPCYRCGQPFEVHVRYGNRMVCQPAGAHEAR